jgi:hypothetical protein
MSRGSTPASSSTTTNTTTTLAPTTSTTRVSSTASTTTFTTVGTTTTNGITTTTVTTTTIPTTTLTTAQSTSTAQTTTATTTTTTFVTTPGGPTVPTSTSTTTTPVEVTSSTTGSTTSTTLSTTTPSTTSSTSSQSTSSTTYTTQKPITTTTTEQPATTTTTKEGEGSNSGLNAQTSQALIIGGVVVAVVIAGIIIYVNRDRIKRFIFGGERAVENLDLEAGEGPGPIGDLAPHQKLLSFLDEVSGISTAINAFEDFSKSGEGDFRDFCISRVSSFARDLEQRKGSSGLTGDLYRQASNINKAIIDSEKLLLGAAVFFQEKRQKLSAVEIGQIKNVAISDEYAEEIFERIFLRLAMSNLVQIQQDAEREIQIQEAALQRRLPRVDLRDIFNRDQSLTLVSNQQDLQLVQSIILQAADNTCKAAALQLAREGADLFTTSYDQYNSQLHEKKFSLAEDLAEMVKTIASQNSRLQVVRTNAARGELPTHISRGNAWLPQEEDENDYEVPVPAYEVPVPGQEQVYQAAHTVIDVDSDVNSADSQASLRTLRELTARNNQLIATKYPHLIRGDQHLGDVTLGSQDYRQYQIELGLVEAARNLVSEVENCQSELSGVSPLGRPILEINSEIFAAAKVDEFIAVRTFKDLSQTDQVLGLIEAARGEINLAQRKAERILRDRRQVMMQHNPLFSRTDGGYDSLSSHSVYQSASSANYAEIDDLEGERERGEGYLNILPGATESSPPSQGRQWPSYYATGREVRREARTPSTWDATYATGDVGNFYDSATLRRGEDELDFQPVYDNPSQQPLYAFAGAVGESQTDSSPAKLRPNAYEVPRPVAATDEETYGFASAPSVPARTRRVDHHIVDMSDIHLPNARGDGPLPRETQASLAQPSAPAPQVRRGKQAQAARKMEGSGSSPAQGGGNSFFG